MTAAEKYAMSAQDFLSWEATQPIKHEFFAGEFFAMAGASDAHVTISLNVASTLRSHLRNTSCRVFIADMKVRVDKVDAFFYPDVMVTCSSNDASRKDYKTEPTLIVEVLSPSTSAFDRGLKFTCYRELASLQEYVLIDPERLSVDVFRRDPSGFWVLHPFVGEDRVTLESVNLSLSMDTVYEDAVPDEPPPVPPARS